MVDKDELVQYIIINTDLKMSAGKVAAQVGHVCTICAYRSMTSDNHYVYENFIVWYYGNQKKIILQAHENVLEKLENQYYSIRDIGCNEIPPNSLTAISLGIMTRSEAEPIVKRLRVFK